MAVELGAAVPVEVPLLSCTWEGEEVKDGPAEEELKDCAEEAEMVVMICSGVDWVDNHTYVGKVFHVLRCLGESSEKQLLLRVILVLVQVNINTVAASFPSSLQENSLCSYLPSQTHF